MRFSQELLQKLEKQCGLRFLFSCAYPDQCKEVIIFDCIEADYIIVDSIREKIMKMPETLFANVGMKGPNAYFVWVRKLKVINEGDDA